MKKELFDGFEVAVKPKEPRLWEAYFCEIPRINETSESEVAALANLNLKWHCYKKECEASGENIPIPASKKNFSGQINIRIEPSIHQALAIEANKSGMSLNSLISKKLGDSNYKIIENNFEIKEIIRVYGSITLLFSSQNDERIGLTFSRFNLDDELRNYAKTTTHSPKGREVVESDENLKNCFSEHHLKKAVRRFLSDKYPINFSKDMPIFKNCILISHETINQPIHNQGMIEARSEDPKDFLICIRE